MRRMEAIREQLKTTPDEQISETDPDARSMISQAKGSGVVGYNVQAAVDAKHHLIVTHEVTNEGNDRAQLSKMATAPKRRWARSKMEAVADRGYFNSPEIKACTEDAGITPLVPKPMTSGARPRVASASSTSSTSPRTTSTSVRRASAPSTASRRWSTA